MQDYLGQIFKSARVAHVLKPPTRVHQHNCDAVDVGLSNMSGTLGSENALCQEAYRLLSLMLSELHAEPLEDGRVQLTTIVSGEVADDISALVSSGEDDEDDGTAEPDSRDLPKALRALEALLAPAPRQGHPVPTWSPADTASPEPAAAAVGRLWPDLVRRPPEAA